MPSSTNVRTALNFPYGWWERTGAHGANVPHANVAARLHAGVLAEMHTVRDGRFDWPREIETTATHGAPDSRTALDTATTFRRVDAEWRPRLDALRNSVETIEARVDQAQTLRQALIAYQVERLAAPPGGGRNATRLRAESTLVEAVAARRQEACH